MNIEDTSTDPRYWSEYELTIDIAGEVSRVSDPISGSYFMLFLMKPLQQTNRG